MNLTRSQESEKGSNASDQSSYEIDLPNAGTAYVIGNLIMNAIRAYGSRSSPTAKLRKN